eukprot:m.387965 g.387965  ORF g.387965 m.387965 type:complete len:140 (+) comp21040_c0_seq7:111-530(+)
MIQPYDAVLLPWCVAIVLLWVAVTIVCTAPLGKNSPWEVPFANLTSGMDVIKALYSGYGEHVDQRKIFTEGDGYLQGEFPLLDRITECHIVHESPRGGGLHGHSTVVAPAWAVGIAVLLLVVGCLRRRHGFARRGFRML